MSSDLAWFKSSYSSDEGGACLEVAYAWRTSSHSNNFDNACVEVAACPHTVHIRDSKNPTGATLTLPPATWSSFATFARA